VPLRFVNPNYHVILVHYPLGVFVLGVFLELFSLLWRKGSIRVAGVWMILIGAILSLPAATSGIYALWDVASSQGVKGERFHLLRLHVIFQSCASLLAVTCAVIGLGASDQWREKLRLPLLLGVTAACGMMVFGSWNGGETVYQQGTAVQIVNQDGELQKPSKHVFKGTYSDIVKYYIGGEKQVHIITAGFALSAAMAALGLSIRRLTTHRAELAQLQAEARAAGKQNGGEPRRVTDDLSMMRSINPEAEIEADFAHVPAGRWWLVSAGVTLVTAVMGYWIMTKIHFAQKSGWEDFVGSLEWDDAKKMHVNRHMAHLALGVGMIALALILGLIARFAPRRPVLLTVFASLMVLVTSAQVWMGVALTFDDEGPLTHFNKEVAPSEVLPSAAPDMAPTTAPALPATAPTASAG
jgi:uncharacterized membrane protein